MDKERESRSKKRPNVSRWWGGIGDDEESKRKTNKDEVYRTSIPRRKKITKCGNEKEREQKRDHGVQVGGPMNKTKVIRSVNCFVRYVQRRIWITGA